MRFNYIFLYAWKFLTFSTKYFWNYFLTSIQLRSSVAQARVVHNQSKF